jgi:hypothetical protein
MKLGGKRIGLLAIAVAVLALVAWVGGSYLSSKGAVTRYKEQLRAAGEKLTIAELVPPPVPPESNSAGIFFQAVPLNNAVTCLTTNQPLVMLAIAPGKAMIGWQQPDIRDNWAGTNSWEEADAALAQYADALDLLHQIIEHPTLDFGLAYQQWPNLMWTHLSPLKSAAQRLSAAAIVHLHDGDTAAAATDIRAMLALVKGTRDERTVISQLVRIAIAHVALAANWELLQATNLTDAQLASVQRDWQELEFVKEAEAALNMERAFTEDTIGRMRNSTASFRQMAGLYGAGVPGGNSGLGSNFSQFAQTLWHGTQTAGKEFMWRTAWSYPDELRALKGEQVFLESLRLAETNGCFRDAMLQQRVKLERIGIKEKAEDVDAAMSAVFEPDLRSLFSGSTLALERYVAKVETVEAARQLTVTAIALKRYQLRHGNYPADLAALVPEFLPVIPKDPVDGKPLRYRRSDDGTFLLYSVGEDGVDNGGDPSRADKEVRSLDWQFGRDWVWPQPATADEIRAFYSSKARR